MSNEQKQPNNTMMSNIEAKRKRGQPKKQPTKVVGVRVLEVNFNEAKEVANLALNKYKQK